MRKAIMAGLVGLWALGAQAQMVAVDAVDPKAMACLHKGGPALSYPDQDLKMRLPGHIRLSLRFTAPDRSPEVTVLFRAASEAMMDDVNWHVRGYRLPCMAPGAEPVSAVQEFSYKPVVTEPITWTAPRPVTGVPPNDPQTTNRQEIMACMRTPKDPPDFAGSSLQRDVSNAFVLLSFSAPDTAPEVKVLYTSAGKAQVQAVTALVEQYRLPCMPVGAKPVVVQQHFQFRPYGVGARVFKDAVPLMSFLSNMKGIRAMSTDFDLTTMACPFQVAWTLGKPGLDNSVGEVGKPDLNRTEFLAWLAGLEMDLKERQFEQLVGQTLIVNVPCLKLALRPQG